jgi:thermostable 8-oxoguanine DNA glycosylase
MIGIYSAGLALVCSRTISLSLLQKLTEIQSTYHSFGLKFDPNYQDYLLFSRMRKFDLSEAIIEEIKAELAAERERLVKTGGMLP